MTRDVLAAGSTHRLSQAFGNLATRVDLFHGRLDLPLRLVDLPGGGLRVTARYSSRVAATTWNDDAPTGVLGLGWSLDTDRISLSESGGYVLGGGRLEPCGAADDELLFQSVRRPLWDIRYGPATQTWRVIREDGATALYRAAMYGVSWGAWAGPSRVASRQLRRRPVAWCLSELHPVGGEALTWAYDTDEVEVAGGLRYTRGVYLREITGGAGRRVGFHYLPKEPFEYVPPHLTCAGEPDAAFQDRFETRALSHLEVHSENEEYILRFAYDLRNVSGHAGDRYTKRFLVGIGRSRGGVRLGYETDAAAPNPGALTSVAFPDGGRAGFEYDDVSPGGFENDLISESPLPGGSPLVFHGPDYAVVLWHAGQRAVLRVHEVDGEWSHTSGNLEIGPVDAAAARFAAGDGFFALSTGTASPLRLFTRDATGEWVARVEPLERSTISGETTLVAGDRFVVWHPGGGTRVHRFTLTPYGWRHDTDEHAGSTQVAVAARHNYYLVAWYDADTRTAPCQSFHRDAAGSWHGRDLGGAGRMFDWDPAYARTYWTLGDGFAVATFLAEGEPRLRLLRWNTDFSLAQDYHRTGRAAVSRVAGAMVGNGPLLLRFDGTTWHSYELGPGSYTYAEDLAIRVHDGEHTTVVYDTDPGRWRVVDAGRRPQAATASGSVITMGEDIHRREPDGSLTRIGRFPAAATLCGAGPAYLLFEDGTAVTALLLGNGEIAGTVTYAGRAHSAGDRSFATVSSSGELCLHRLPGRATLPVVVTVRHDSEVTRYVYDTDTAMPADGVRFARAERLSGENGEGGRTVCTFHNGRSGLPGLRRTPATREAEPGALLIGLAREMLVLDGDGFEVFAEHSVWSALPLDAGPDSPVGLALPAVMAKLSVSTVFLSGLPLFELPGLLAGELDGGVLAPAVRTAFATFGLPLREAAGVAAVVPGRHWEIVSGREAFTIRRRGRFLQALGSVRRATRNYYDPATGRLVSQRTAETGSDGTRRVIRAELTPAWRLPEYAGVKAARMLTAQATRAITNVTEGITVSASATTYRPDPAGRWARHAAYTWRGETDLAPPFDHRPDARNPGWRPTSPDEARPRTSSSRRS